MVLDENTILFIVGCIFIAIIILWRLVVPIVKQETERHVEKNVLNLNDIYEQVETLIGEGKHVVAQKMAKRYLTEDPENYSLRLLLAKSLVSVNMMEDAIEHLEKLVIVNSNNIEIALMLANAYKSTDKNNNAVDIYLRILKEYPNSLDIMYDLAELYESLDYKKSAYNFYTQILAQLKKEDEMHYVYFKLAKLGKDMKDNKTAIKNITIALEKEPDNLEYLKVYKELCVLSGDYKNAEAIINKMAELKPGNIDLKAELAELCLNSDKNKEALEIAISALTLTGVQETVFKEIIFKAIQKASLAQVAIDMLSETILKNPANIILHEILVEIYKFSKRYEEAKSTYEALMKIAGLNKSKYAQEVSNMYWDWAKELKNTGDTDAIIEKLNIAKEYNPLNPEIYNTLSQIYLHRNEYVLAIEQANQAVELSSSNITYLYNLAYAYELNKEKEKAIELYNKILKINPEHKSSARNLKLLQIL